MDLETEDFEGVDILAAGGPYHGQGSARNGDHYDVARLERFASDARELANEVRAAVKLGHSPEQQLLRESGLLDEHGAPAAGWLDSLRVEGDKLKADLRRVPKKLAGIIRAGGFRTRSVEMQRYTSPSTGKTYDWVITGLALLGAKAPAVRTLDDIVALYAAPEGLLPDLDDEAPEGTRTVNFEAGSIPDPGMADATLTLTSEQTGGLAKALGLKAAELAPEKLLAAIETATKTATQAVADQAKTELEAATKKLSDAEAELKTLKAAAGAADGEGAKELAETLKALAASAEKGEKAAEDLRVMRRETLLDNAIRAGKLEPAMRAQYVKLYDASPDVTRETIEALPKRDDLFKVFGADGADISGEGPVEDDEAQKEADARYRAYCAAVGIDAPTRTAEVAA